MASSVYLFAFLACLAAAVVAARARQVPGHVRVWISIGVLFALLAASRFFGVEQGLTEALRESLKESGAYGERRSWQAPVVALLTVIAGAVGLFLAYRFAERQHGRRNHARTVGAIAALAMLGLVALRLASFHAVDALLFGPLKLNWVLDIGSTLAVIGAAIYYIRIVHSPRAAR